MSRMLSTSLVLVLALLGAGLLGACGDDEEALAVEGEPLELGDLLYNVQITRFLNPDSAEDRAYLRGLPDPPTGQDYLAVFMRIQNEGDGTQRIPSTFPVENNRGQTFKPLDLDNPYALELGTEIPPGGQLPEIDTPAQTGPIKGSMILYLIDEEATENRPLEMSIPSTAGERGTIELDL
jgi:hypothetical protein